MTLRKPEEVARAIQGRRIMLDDNGIDQPLLAIIRARDLEVARHVLEKAKAVAHGTFAAIAVEKWAEATRNNPAALAALLEEKK